MGTATEGWLTYLTSPEGYSEGLDEPDTADLGIMNTPKLWQAQ